MTFMVRNIGVGQSGYSGSLTAGYNSVTHFTGFFVSTLGTLTPGTFRGITINALYDNNGLNSVFSIAQAGLSQNYFNTLKLAGLGSKTSASASFTNTGGASTWTWSSTFGMTNGGVYAVTIV
jgi:hypothetical protein